MKFKFLKFEEGEIEIEKINEFFYLDLNCIGVVYKVIVNNVEGFMVDIKIKFCVDYWDVIYDVLNIIVEIIG